MTVTAEPLRRSVGRCLINTLDREEQPIILVPGIMGSRLHVAGDPGEAIWDPDNTFAMLRLADLYTSSRAEFVGLRTRAEVYQAPRTAANATAAQRARGWGGLAWGFYGEGLRDLERRSASIGGVVYGFGYDWRQSNWLSGAQLARRIQSIREAHGNRKVLVVTHSMGGLVTRAACRQGAEEHILGVVHTMQPADGTPLAYRTAKTGAAALHWVLADIVLGRILGRTAVQAAAMAADMRGSFELYPNDSHSRATGNEANVDPGYRPRYAPWLTYDAGLAVTLPRDYSIYDVYLENTGRLGVIDFDWYRRNTLVHIDEAYILDDFVSGPHIADGMTAGIQSARQFHRDRLRGYVHPNTSVVAGDGLACDVAVHIDRETHWFSGDTGAAAMIREARGDATVSISSATALPLTARPDLGISARDRQAFVTGVEHAAAFGASAPFRDAVWRLCEQVMQCATPAATTTP